MNTRLKIATQIIAGSFAHPNGVPTTCTQALEWADLLIRESKKKKKKPVVK